MFTKTLLPDTVRAIKLVSEIPIVKKAYLAGGTALALHLGHRISVDLDFFTQEELEERILSADLHRLSEFKEDGVAWRTVWGKIGETKFSLFYYKYPLLAKTHPFMDIHLLDVKDIAAMKINAVEDRGSKRDFITAFKNTPRFNRGDELNADMSSSFGRGNRGLKPAEDVIDLYFLSKRFNFSKMFEFYDRKYRCLKSHKYNILKSLNYFEDAESEDSPRMFKSINWPEIKAFFQKEVKKLSSDLI